VLVDLELCHDGSTLLLEGSTAITDIIPPFCGVASLVLVGAWKRPRERRGPLEKETGGTTGLRSPEERKY